MWFTCGLHDNCQKQNISAPHFHVMCRLSGESCMHRPGHGTVWKISPTCDTGVTQGCSTGCSSKGD